MGFDQGPTSVAISIHQCPSSVAINIHLCPSSVAINIHLYTSASTNHNQSQSVAISRTGPRNARAARTALPGIALRPEPVHARAGARATRAVRQSETGAQRSHRSPMHAYWHACLPLMATDELERHLTSSSVSPVCCCMRCQALPCYLEGSPLPLTYPLGGKPARRRPGRPAPPCSSVRSDLVVTDRLAPLAEAPRVPFPN